MEALKPLQSGPGVYVCEPVVRGADADASALGSGAARWLHFALGGVPELDRTPGWPQRARVCTELKQPDGRLEGARAVEAGRRTGATHVLAGEVSGTAPACRLVYHLVEVASSREIGEPLVLETSVDKAAADLPALAREVARRLRVPDASVPRVAEATGMALVRYGRLPNARIPTPKALDELKELAPGCLPAAFSYGHGVYSTRGNVDDELGLLVESLLARAPENPLAVYEAAGLFTAHSDALRPRIQELMRKHPTNTLGLMAASRVITGLRDVEPSRDALSDAVRSAPESPQLWMQYGQDVMGAADRIRRGKMIGEMSGEDLGYVMGLYPTGIAAFRKAVELDPDFARAWYELSVAAALGGDMDLSDQAYERAVALGEDLQRIYAWGIHRNQPWWRNDPKARRKAALAFARAPSDSPGNAEWAARELQRAGYADLEPIARETYRKQAESSAAASPKDAKAQLQLGQSLKGSGKADKAEAALRQAVALQPQNAEAHFELGDLLNTRKRYAEAEPALREAIRLEPKLWKAHKVLALALQEQKKYEAEIDALVGFNKLRPWDPIGHVMRGFALSQLGRNDDALKELRLAVRFNARDRDAQQGLWGFLTEQNRHQEALVAAEQATKASPDDAAFHFLAGYSYLKLRRLVEAEQENRKAIAITPTYAMATENLAIVLAEQGRVGEARRIWKKVLTMGDPDAAAEARHMLKTHP